MSLSPQQTAELHELLWRLRAADASPEQLARLERLVCEDPEVRAFYVRYMHLCADLHWNGVEKSEERGLDTSARGLGTSVPSEARGIGGSGVGVQEIDDFQIPNQQILNLEVPAQLGTEVPSPLVIIDSSAAIHRPLFSTDSPLGGWLFSYAAATVITGMLVLSAWMYKVSLHGEVALAPPAPLHIDGPPQPMFVGRITGEADCHWADGQPAPVAAVPLRRKYELVSGLMEISYESGAKVILQGPCVYEIDSPAGGFLSLGKLTARVETKVEGGGGKAEAAGSRDVGAAVELPHQPGAEKSPFPLPPSPFVVGTPTAVVTDLGTEFGVEVDKSGATRSHVFRGKVEVHVAGAGNAKPQVIPLGENESLQVQPGQGPSRVAAVSRTSPRPNSSSFVRQMPRRVRIKLFNTGVRLKEGEPDPHWQLAARSDDPKFKPRPALVSPAASDGWLPNQPRISQWISLVGDLSEVPDRVTYTFRTTFDLSGLCPETAVLTGGFLADNHVNAIRLNGKELPVAEHGWNVPFEDFTKFSATKGFVEGANTLEFDVWNGIGHDEASRMALCVELEGSALRDCHAPPPTISNETQHTAERKETQ